MEKTKEEIERQAKTFWSQNSKDYETWWVTSNDVIHFKSDDLWRFMNAYRSLPKEQEQEITNWKRIAEERKELHDSEITKVFLRDREIERLKKQLRESEERYNNALQRNVEKRERISELEAQLKDGELHFAQWYSEMQEKKALSAEPKEAQPEELKPLADNKGWHFDPELIGNIQWCIAQKGEDASMEVIDAALCSLYDLNYTITKQTP